MAPHGKGKTTDVFFEVHSDRQDVFHYNYELNITFPNEKDGIQPFVFTENCYVSELKSPHLAPKEGYNPTFQRTSSSEGRKSQTNSVSHRNHWMRVRSKENKKGELLSSNYVKIYGDFPDMIYYFNPTPNDRNLEFDREKNLLQDLSAKEKVNAP